MTWVERLLASARRAAEEGRTEMDVFLGQEVRQQRRLERVRGAPWGDHVEHGVYRFKVSELLEWLDA
jgi:hypothetical protein